MSNLAEKNKVVVLSVNHTTSKEKEVVVADLKEGWLALPNSMMDMLCRTKFSDQETRVFRAIVRKTFGFNKEADWICLDQFQDLTGINRKHINKVIKSLVGRNIVFKDGRKYGINLTISDWVNKTKITQVGDKNKSPKQVINNTQIGDVITQTGVICHINEGLQKKDNITKDNIQNTYVQNVRSSLPEVSNSVFINLPLKDGTACKVTTEEINYYKELYPMTDVEQSLRSMLGWLNANPAKRKTKKGIKTFITGWLNRENKNTVQHRQEVASNQAPDFHKCDLSWADDLGW